MPKLVEYLSDEISYLWIKHELGVFPRAGYYDWVLFNLGDAGKESVTKILDIGVTNKHENFNSYAKR